MYKHWPDIFQGSFKFCTYKVMITPVVYSDFLLQKTGLGAESSNVCGLSLNNGLTPSRHECNKSDIK